MISLHDSFAFRHDIRGKNRDSFSWPQLQWKNTKKKGADKIATRTKKGGFDLPYLCISDVVKCAAWTSRALLFITFYTIFIGYSPEILAHVSSVQRRVSFGALRCSKEGYSR